LHECGAVTICVLLPKKVDGSVAFVDVNEESPETAAPAVIIKTRSTPRYPRFRVDHPLLFLIREKATGGILFLGRYAAPSK
jgi:serpin B